MKVKGRSEDQSEDFRQNKQHYWLSPTCIWQAQVEEKTYKRRSQSAFSRTLSSTCPDSLSLFLSPVCVHSLSLSLPPHALLHSLLFKSWILLLSSK